MQSLSSAGYEAEAHVRWPEASLEPIPSSIASATGANKAMLGRSYMQEVRLSAGWAS